jgi:chemotaxis protein methyltransferase CheR
MPVAQDDRLLVPDGIPVLLRDLIHERLGTFFDEARLDTMLEKLEAPGRARNCRSILDYYYLLKDDNNGHQEWERVMDALAVQETYFWREMSQINALVDEVVPAWFKKSSLPFRVWSAACCTGEEPYTIAMALVEAGLGENPVEITGSDASVAAVQAAQRAVYREKSFRALPPPLRLKYFEPVQGGWSLSPEIKRRVIFKRANLFEPKEVASLARAQAIFCRNAFIYFSRHAIRQTVAMMAAKMPPGGHLFVGASESLLRLTTDFELKEVAGALVYLRL